MWNHEYTIIGEMCSEVNNTSSQSSSLSFHTKGSSLWIVVYWYNGFTSLNARVSVKVSKCQGIYLNLCSYHHYCRFASQELYDSFMKAVIGHTKLSFSDCYNEYFTQTFELPPGECVVLILSDKMVPYQALDKYQFFLQSVCEMFLYSTSGKNQNSDVSGSLGEGSYVEVVGSQDLINSKHKIWNNILKYRHVMEFTQVKFIKEFLQHSLDKVNALLVKFYSRHMKNQVNILLSSVQKKPRKVQYELATYQPGLAISDIILMVVGLQYKFQYNIQYGFDWMLSIDTNLKLDSLQGKSLCTFNFHRTSTFNFYHITPSFSAFVGKSLHIYYT